MQPGRHKNHLMINRNKRSIGDAHGNSSESLGMSGEFPESSSSQDLRFETLAVQVLHLVSNPWFDYVAKVRSVRQESYSPFQRPDDFAILSGGAAVGVIVSCFHGNSDGMSNGSVSTQSSGISIFA